MTIQWSDEDGLYIVSFPEWEAAGHIAHTHGATYEEAVGNGREGLELLIEYVDEIGVNADALAHYLYLTWPSDRDISSHRTKDSPVPQPRASCLVGKYQDHDAPSLFRFVRDVCMAHPSSPPSYRVATSKTLPS